MLEIHWVGEKGEEHVWVGLNQGKKKLAPHMKMQGRYDVQEVRRYKY